MSQHTTFGIESFFHFTEEERASVQPPSTPYTPEDAERALQEQNFGAGSYGYMPGYERE